MDLEDLFQGGHRNKHGHHDKHSYRHEDHDHDHHDSHDRHDHHEDAPYPRGPVENRHETPFQGHRPEYRGHGEHDLLRTLTHLSGNVPHLKWIVALVAVGLVVVLLVGGTLAVMLFPVVGRALGFVSQTGIQGAIESVVPPGGVKGAIDSIVPPGGVKGVIESAVPATGLKGVADSAGGLLQRIWNGKPTEAPPKPS